MDNLVNTIQHTTAFELLRKLEDNSVDLVLVDPPYNFGLETKEKYLAEFRRVCKGTIIIFCPPENQWPESDQYLFWLKPLSTKNTTVRYSRFVEMIQVYGNGFSNELTHWSNRTNVFNDCVDTPLHPFRKPPSLIKRLIINHTKIRDIVLDVFTGSGVVPEVCQQTSRRFIACDENEEYVLLAKRQLMLLELNQSCVFCGESLGISDSNVCLGCEEMQMEEMISFANEKYY